MKHPAGWRYRLTYILLVADYRPTALINALLCMGWGGWLLGPFDSFSASPVTFRAMRELAPEVIWGIGLTVLGLVRIWSLLGGAPRRVRIWSALTTTLAWLFIAVMVTYSNPTTLAAPVYSIIALAACWAYVRARLEVRGWGNS